MKLFIKNMVCNRCIMVVKNELENAGNKVISIQLGEVELKENKHFDKKKINEKLRNLGFELIDDKRAQIIEKIKNEIVTLIHHTIKDTRINYSDYLAKKLNYEYNYLSNLFSEVEGITIEKFIIAQKVERVKELLVYDELSLSEIAYQMGYSSVAYLSTQFKKVTGLTPTYFKNVKENKRVSLDKL
jgi:YesN/AraC family two-component response regulator